VIISQDTIIGPQLNLLATGGNSQVVRGNMLIIPIKESVLYVEPIYVRAINANALPEQKKVVVYFKNQVVMEDTLDIALGKVFPPKEEKTQKHETSQIPTDTMDATLEELIGQANSVFEEAQSAQRLGNWAEYGSKISELEDLLKRLNELTNAAPNEETPEIE
jgi:uncharacterized membrane protein (UPF0182 family)